MRRLLILALPLALVGCSGLEQALGLSTPPAPVPLQIKVQGIPNANVEVKVSGAGRTYTYYDDGTGFSRSEKVAPGIYTASAERPNLEGVVYKAVITSTGANGNRTADDTNSVEVRDESALSSTTGGTSGTGATPSPAPTPSNPYGFSVRYVAVSGAVKLEVTGLPEGATPKVKLSGARDLGLQLGANTVNEGQYTVIVEDVLINGQIYTGVPMLPAEAQGALTVQTGQRNTLRVVYRLPQP